MVEKVKLWFGSYTSKYEINEPFFFPTEKMEIAQDLEQYYADIYEELKVLWQPGSPDDISHYRDYSAYDEHQFPPNSWKKLVFMVWGIKNKKVCEKFPLVSSMLEKYPAVTSSFVTKLSAHSLIAGHCGTTNAQFRIHLGLEVPQGDADTCGIEVGNEKHKWENGKTFAFVDAHYHHVWNNLDADRYVLIVDVLRPEFISRRGFICARIIISQIYSMVAFRQKSKLLLNRMPPSLFFNMLTYIAYLPIWTVILLNNKFGFLKL